MIGADYWIVGGMRPARGGAAFVRPPLVLSMGGSYLVSRSLEGDVIKGEPVDEDEWRQLLAAGEALKLREPSPAEPHLAMWLMRPNFWFRDEAGARLLAWDALRGSETQDQTLVLLVDEYAAGTLRDDWTARAFNHAWAMTEAGRISEAIEAAEVAVDLARGMVADHIALAALLYERAGDKERAEAYLHMARNSRGDDFYARSCEKKDRFALGDRDDDGEPAIHPGCPRVNYSTATRGQ